MPAFIPDCSQPSPLAAFAQGPEHALSIDGYTLRAHTLPRPVPATVGGWLLDHGLYAAGRDFTSARVVNDPSAIGNSMMKKLWQGEPFIEQGLVQSIRLWLISHAGQPVGAVAWLRTFDDSDAPSVLLADEVRSHPNHRPRATLPVVPMGLAMVFMQAPHRGKGLIKSALMTAVVPELFQAARQAHARNAIPLLAARDATTQLLDSVLPLPLTETIRITQQVRNQVWDVYNDWQMSQRFDHQSRRPLPFLVSPVPLAPARKRRSSINR